MIFYFLRKTDFKVGIGTYGKFRNKVKRNRVRRRMKAAFLKNLDKFPKNIWLVILAPPDFLNIEFSEIEKRVSKIAEIINKFN